MRANLEYIVHIVHIGINHKKICHEENYKTKHLDNIIVG